VGISLLTFFPPDSKFVLQGGDSLETLTKVADAKGRITLGAEYAKKTFLIEKINEDTVTLKLAEVVPRKEAWLWKNKVAFTKVMEGLADAQKGRFEKVDLKKYEA
jgi:hypothetical protein